MSCDKLGTFKSFCPSFHFSFSFSQSSKNIYPSNLLKPSFLKNFNFKPIERNRANNFFLLPHLSTLIFHSFSLPHCQQSSASHSATVAYGSISGLHLHTTLFSLQKSSENPNKY
ncbi:hypothetical protein LguiB_020166 [Lonicera macranthoides]